jgi:ABC-2 type transport system ATP-binding protein
MNVLHISGITKQYANKTVLNSIQCSVEAGSCFWLVGRNGAGKSTLINILADLIAPDSGTVSFGDLSYATDELAIKRNLGVLPDKNPAIPQLTGWEYLQFVGLLDELPPDECKRRAESLLAYFFDETEDAHKRISSYSHGMTKKIGLCAALLHRPEYLILDEPFAGLDPVSSAKLVQFLQSYLTLERAIFLSSHDLGYAQKIMTHIGILENGVLQFVGSADDFASSKHTIEESILQILQPKESNIHELNWLLQ